MSMTSWRLFRRSCQVPRICQPKLSILQSIKPDDHRQLLCETHMRAARTTQYGFACSRVARGSACPPFRQTHMTSIGSAVGQRYARVAGILLLLSIVFGAWGEGYVPSMLIVS